LDKNNPPDVAEGENLGRKKPVTFRFPLILTLALGWTMIYADRLGISPLLLIIEREFNLNNFQASLIISIYFIAYVLFTVPITIAATRYGFRRTLTVLFFLTAVSIGAAGFLGYTYFLLLFFIALHGLGAGGYYPTAYTVSNTVVPKEKSGFFSSLINSGMAFGSILGLTIGGPILLIFPDNWHAVLLVLSFFSLLVAGLLFKYVPDVRLQKPLSGAEILVQFKAVFKYRDLVFLCASQFCSIYGYWVILSWAPSFLQTRGENVISSGATAAVFSVVAIVPSILIGRHTDKIGRKRVSLLIFPLAAVSILFMGYSANIYEFLGGIVLYGIIGKLTFDPISLGWITDIIPAELIGASLAFLNVTAMTGSILAPAITGALADESGSLAYGFYFGAAIVLVGTLFVALTNTKRR
jgi:MFS family permease